MRKILFSLLLLLSISPCSAQNITCTTRPPGDNTNACASTAFVIANGGGGGGMTALPLNQIYVGNASAIATAVAMAGDCSIVAAGTITCTKTNGVSFAASATTDTTVATNITSGTLPLARLALASASFYVGNGSNNPAAVAMSGDCTLTNTGAVTCTKTGGVALGALATLNVGTGLTSSGGNLNTTPTTANSQTTNYTLQTTDCGKSVVLGTGATGFFNITIPSPSGFPATCQIQVINGDTTRGKGILGTDAPSTLVNPPVLFPTKSFTLSIVNSLWFAPQPGRWRIPPGGLTIFADFTNGADESNDCLAASTGNACKTLEYALGLINDNFDFHGDNSAPSQVTVSMAADDTTGVHQSFHAFVGANGGAAVKINGNGHSITAPVQFFFGTVIQFRNITFSNSGGNCLESFWGAKIYVLDLVTFGACSGAQVHITSGPGHVEFINNFTISGSAGFFINLDSGGSVQMTPGITATFSTPTTYTFWILDASPAYVNLQGLTFNLGGNAVTGSRALIEINGAVLQSTSTLAVTGASSGTSSVCRLTMASTASLAEAQRVFVAGITGATGCNTVVTNPPSSVGIHIVSATQIELTGTTFGGSYINGGTVQIGIPGTADATVNTGGQLL